jgi:hypothetical protein
MTSVRNYTDADLINSVKNTNGFKGIPKGNWLIFVRSKEDTPNKYDDKVYLMKGYNCIKVSSCTTNSGSYGLLNFRKWNKKGTAVIKFDEWYYNTYRYGLHRGRMEALRQVKPMKYYRDGDKDLKTDEKGTIYQENAYTNIHFNSYKNKTKLLTWTIGAWSVGCMVMNDANFYYKSLIPLFRGKKDLITVCCLKED